jgi:beta-glucosidase
MPLTEKHGEWFLLYFSYKLLMVRRFALLVVIAAPLGAQTGDRVETLLRQMTLQEKAGQLNQLTTGYATGPGGITSNHDELLAAGKIGSLFNANTALQTNTYQKIVVEKSRLHIPVLFGLDIIHGFRTIFPVPLGLAATWDPELIERTARIAAEEASRQGVRWTFSPMVDITRDARWGRIIEGAGEDPYLGSQIAQAYVRGYQGKSLRDPTSILACVKHFVGYGAAEAGREYNTTEIPERLLRQVYLVPFRAALEAGAATFMSAFNSLNEVPASANPFTLTQILRKEWRFQGFVVSDYNSVREIMAHGIANDEATAALKGFSAGADMDMESHLYLEQLPKLVQSGQLSMVRLDDAVRRVLRFKEALGLFDKPYVDGATAAQAAPSESSLALARQAAEESFVLLKNDGVLPLHLQAGARIALVGPLAESPEDMLGSWAAAGRKEEAISLRMALRQRSVQDHFQLTDTAGDADVIVAAMGERAIATGEGSARAELDLPPDQEKLLENLTATGKPVVLVLFSGRPLTIGWAAAHVPSILEAWFPGLQAGPALVRTLFGDSNPSGRLTVSFPRSVGQEPIYYNALNTGRPMSHPDEPIDANFGNRYFSRYIDEKNSPLYPFGYGLSYTKFAYSDVQLSHSTISAAALNRNQASLTISATITNTGSRPGTETAQLYIRLRGTSVVRPIRELEGFTRVTLAPGESRRVEFHLGKDELKFWNIDMQDVVEPAALTVWVAKDSESGVPAEVTITR